MTATAVPLEQSLSALLRTGSQAEHTAAESSRFMSELLAGRVDENGYAHYLSLLRQVYVALETTAEALTGDPIASTVIDPALARLEAIDADLDFWGRPEVESPAASAYADRIMASASWGGLFIAHHYTRYLGDLSGGQAIGRILSREFGLTDRGVAFYAFADVPKPKLYKDAYRARLDALPLDETQRAAVLDEVKTVFALNGGLFRELTTQLDRYRR